MAVTVSKDGPHFTSGAISWSDYRDKFKKTSSGSVSASEMHRITSTSNTNPTMPDATENASVPTGGTIAVSSIRNTIKYYNITVTGNNNQFNIGSQSWNSNYGKNIRKWTYLQGSYYSNSTGTPALRTGSTTYNNTLDITSTVKAAGGSAGTSGGDGGNGGNALVIAGGNNIHVDIDASGRIWAGGGGGGGGGDGISGAFGTCRKEYDIQGCAGLPACNQGGTGTLISSYTGDCCNKIRYCGGPWESFCWHECWGDWKYGTCRFEANSTTPGVPSGGNGGLGQGNQQSRSNGTAGGASVAPSCAGIGTMSGADMTLIGGSASTSGGDGGNGGDWGQSGGTGGARNWVAVTSAGWNNAGWMNNFAVYPSNNNTLSGVNHERTWDVYVSASSTAHRIDVRADNWAEILWDGASLGTLGNNTTFPFPAAFTNATVFNVLSPSVGWHTITARVFNGTGNYDWNTNPGGVAWVFKESSSILLIATSRSPHQQGGDGGSAGAAISGSGYYVTGNNGTTVKGSI